MNCTQITCPAVPALGITRPIIRYASSEANARKVREQLVTLTGVKKKDILIQPLYINPGKDDMLQYMNDAEARHDGQAITCWFQPVPKAK